MELRLRVTSFCRILPISPGWYLEYVKQSLIELVAHELFLDRALSELCS